MTTWLTQITPDYRNDYVRRDLRDVTAMHKRVMLLAPNGLGEQAPSARPPAGRCVACYAASCVARSPRAPGCLPADRSWQSRDRSSPRGESAKRRRPSPAALAPAARQQACPGCPCAWWCAAASS